MNFWKSLDKPIIGLAPMDGVTDAAFRYMVDSLGSPSVMMTEFVPVEAIKAGASRVLDAFLTHDTKTPFVAQLYGTDLDAYYLATLAVCELGFDGVDINMGCPAKSVESRGAGAGLIKNPKLARQIIDTVRKATLDYTKGAYSSHPIPESIRDRVRVIGRKRKCQTAIPVSVKTRIGYESNTAGDWISEIAKEGIHCITLHGRTFAQMYRGSADWDAISEAAAAARDISPETLVLGNGDIRHYSDVADKINKCELLQGVLVGRAALGNPWFFLKNQLRPQRNAIFAAMLKHAETFQTFFPNGHFLALRKHMLWYAKGFDGAKQMHEALQKIKNIEDLRLAINEAQST